MALTMTVYDAMLKEFYLPLIQETLNNEVLLKKYLEESDKSFSGRRVIFPVHYSRNSGVGARAEASALPTAGAQGHYNAYVTAAYIYGRLDITGQVKAASKTGFADALANEMEGLKTDITVDIGRQSYNEGYGILARCYEAASASAMKVINQFGQPGQHGARYISINEVIDLGSAGTPSANTNLSSGDVVSSVTISVNSGTLYDTVNLTASNTETSNTFVFRFKAGGAGLEIKGLRAIVDNITATNCYGFSAGYNNGSSIFNIDRSVVAGWNSRVDQNSGTTRIIDSYLIQRNMSQIKKASGKEIDIMFGEYDCMDAFWDSIASDRRFMSKNFDAGVETLTYNGKTMVKDLLAPYNELFLLHKDSLNWYVELPLEFAEDEGHILKYVPGYDRWEAFMRAYIQLAPSDMSAPNANGVIRDIKTIL
jgi:hypothetical protein